MLLLATWNNAAIKLLLEKSQYKLSGLSFS